MTIVYSLGIITDREIFYDLPPKEALVQCYADNPGTHREWDELKESLNGFVYGAFWVKKENTKKCQRIEIK